MLLEVFGEKVGRVGEADVVRPDGVDSAPSSDDAGGVENTHDVLEGEADLSLVVRRDDGSVGGEASLARDLADAVDDDGLRVAEHLRVLFATLVVGESEGRGHASEGEKSIGVAGENEGEKRNKDVLDR